MLRRRRLGDGAAFGGAGQHIVLAHVHPPLRSVQFDCGEAGANRTTTTVDDSRQMDKKEDHSEGECLPLGGWADGWAVGRTVGRLGGRLGGWADGWAVGRTVGQLGGRLGGWADGWTVGRMVLPLC